MLTEAQIQRYARQVLLRGVGERGQEALGSVVVELGLHGRFGAAASAYLSAGGSAVEPADDSPTWASSGPLVETAPERRIGVVASPHLPGTEGVVVGERSGSVVLWSRGEAACPECLLDEARSLAPPDTEGLDAVLVGSLVALLVQRRALGLAAALEGVALSAEGLPEVLVAPPCSHHPPVVPAEVLARLVAHLTTALPDEGCALLLSRGDAVRFVPMENAQAAHHARDPQAFPRTARTAFSLDPKAWLAVLRAADTAGERVLAIAHSHPDGPAEFSAEDRRWAAPDGEPLFPGTAHLVIAFEDRRPAGARWVLWSSGDFREWPCPLPPELT